MERDEISAYQLIEKKSILAKIGSIWIIHVDVLNRPFFSESNQIRLYNQSEVMLP